MTNLILHKNDDGIKPWEKSMLTMETASSSNNNNRGVTSFSNKYGSKKLSNLSAEASNLNLFLNPMVESFLSFNIAQNTTALGPSNNITGANQQIDNIFD